jgi:hypothetical protein
MLPSNQVVDKHQNKISSAGGSIIRKAQLPNPVQQDEWINPVKRHNPFEMPL